MISENRNKCLQIYNRLRDSIYQQVKGEKPYIVKFLRFLAIKAVYGNSCGNDILPSTKVDKIWKNNQGLNSQIEEICGKKLEYNRVTDSEELGKGVLLLQFLSERIFQGLSEGVTFDYYYHWKHTDLQTLLE